MSHVPSDASVSDSVPPNLLYCRFGTAESDTGHDCMHIRPHYQSIRTFNWYSKVVVMPHVPSDVSVSDSTPPNLLYSRFGAAESDTEHDCMHIRHHCNSILTFNWY